MSMVSLITKAGIMGTLVVSLYGTVEDVVKGVLDGVSVNAAWTEMHRIHGKLMEFYSLEGRYPQTQNEMIDYFNSEFDTDIQSVLTDPWDSKYNVFTPQYEVHCNGPDTHPKTHDDFGVRYPNNVNRPF